jgi:hypothetical protein
VKVQENKTLRPYMNGASERENGIAADKVVKEQAKPDNRWG